MKQLANVNQATISLAALVGLGNARGKVESHLRDSLGKEQNHSKGLPLFAALFQERSVAPKNQPAALKKIEGKANKSIRFCFLFLRVSAFWVQ